MTFWACGLKSVGKETIGHGKVKRQRSLNVIEMFPCIASSGAVTVVPYRSEELITGCFGMIKARHVCFFWFNMFYFPILNLRQNAEKYFTVTLNEVLIQWICV